MTRVLLVDDQTAFRRQFRRLLVHAGMEVVGEVEDIASAERLAPLCQPDLAVVDMMLPGVNGIEGTRRLRARWPGLRVILISAFQDHARVYEASALEAGAEAFFAKDDLDLSVVSGWNKG